MLYLLLLHDVGDCYLGGIFWVNDYYFNVIIVYVLAFLLFGRYIFFYFFNLTVNNFLVLFVNVYKFIYDEVIIVYSLFFESF